MTTFKKALSISLLFVSLAGFSQTMINQDVSMENGKIRIQVTKEENGKKEIFDKTYNAEGMSQDAKQALIDRVTDSLTAGSGKNMKMRVKVDRDASVKIEGKNRGKDVIIKKGGKTIIKGDEDNDEMEIDIDIDGDDDMNFNFNGKDFDLHDFQNKMGDLGKTLQFKFKEFEPQMKKFGEEFGSQMEKLGRDMEPKFKKFEKDFNFNFDQKSGSSKTIKDLNAYPNKPNNNRLNVEFSAPEKGNVTITVTDITGKEIGKEKVNDFSGEYIGQVDLKGNAKGTVFVTVVQGDDGTVKRVVLN